MKYRLFLISIFPFILSSLIYACEPSFECKKAKTKIEKEICRSALLRDLDRTLSIVYKKALEMSSNAPKIKADQIRWMHSRKEEDLFETYKGRILDLMKNKNLRTFFLDEFIKNPSKIEKPIACLAIASLWSETSNEPNDWDMSGYFTESFFLPLTDCKILVVLSTASGAHRGRYHFFTLRKSNGNITLQSFTLPQPKTFKLEFENPTRNSLSGGFKCRGKKGQYFLDYTPDGSFHKFRDSCTWQINSDGAKIVKEQQRYRPDSKPPFLDQKMLLGAWEEEDNSTNAPSEKEAYYFEELKFSEKEGKVQCGGLALNKGANQDICAIHKGTFRGTVGIIKNPKQIQNFDLKEQHFIVKVDSSVDRNLTVYLELINENTLKVLTFEQGSLGDPNVSFDGIYLRRKQH